MFSGKAEKVTAELEQAEQVMLEHEKEHFAVKFEKHNKHNKDKITDGGPEKYSSLYSDFDQLKPHEDLPPGIHKVLQCKIQDENEYMSNNNITVVVLGFLTNRYVNIF